MDINTRDMAFVNCDEEEMQWVKVDGVTVYEAWKELIASGVPPLTLLNCKGVDLINYKLYGNSVQGRLPGEYQQVEYLENNGYQYIDTGIIPNNNTGIDIIYESLKTVPSQYIAGSRKDNAGTVTYAINGSTSRTDWDIRFDGSAIYSNVARSKSKIRTKVSLNNGNGTWILTNLDTGESSSIDISNQSVTATNNLFLFAYNNIYIHSNLRIYSCKIYDGETLIRDFIPCYRKNDDVIGMYDLANGVFYENAGTIAFIKGNIIPSQETPIEVESVGDYDETTGKYKIPVKVTGKNLLKLKDYTSSSTTIDYTIENQTVYKKVRIDVQTSWLIQNTVSAEIFDAVLKPGTYIWSLHNVIGKPIEDAYIQLTTVSETINWNVNEPIVLTETATISAFRNSSSMVYNAGETQSFQIQIEQGDTVTDYEPFKEEIVNIYLNEPLRKIGDYRDYIDFEKKQIVRKVANKIFDGSETWTKHTTTSDGYGAFRNDGLLKPLIGAPISATFMTHFNLTYKGATADFIPGEYRFTYSSGSNIAGSRLYVSAVQTTVEDFVDWLSKNKPTIYYPIEDKPEEINLPNIPTLKGTTVLSIDTTIQPSNLEVVYKGKKVKTDSA